MNSGGWEGSTPISEMKRIANYFNILLARDTNEWKLSLLLISLGAPVKDGKGTLFKLYDVIQVRDVKVNASVLLTVEMKLHYERTW